MKIAKVTDLLQKQDTLLSISENIMAGKFHNLELDFRSIKNFITDWRHSSDFHRVLSVSTSAVFALQFIRRFFIKRYFEIAN